MPQGTISISACPLPQRQWKTENTAIRTPQASRGHYRNNKEKVYAKMRMAGVHCISRLLGLRCARVYPIALGQHREERAVTGAREYIKKNNVKDPTLDHAADFAL